LHCRDDEHQLIAQYCQSLNGGDAVLVPRSPVQIMVAIDQEQREELEAMIQYVKAQPVRQIYILFYKLSSHCPKRNPKVLPSEVAL
jgi:hypothetical protein